MCKVQPPESNLLTVQSPNVNPAEDDDTPTKSGDKGKKAAGHDSSNEDEDDNFHPAKGPLTLAAILSASQIVAPQEIDVLTAGIKHIATLAHADHPTDKTTHLWPHLTTIELAIQEGLPIPHYPPRMATQQPDNTKNEGTNQQVNMTQAGLKPTPAVLPKEDNGTPGGKALISPPEVFTGDWSKVDDFLQDFKLCWRLNWGHPAMEVPYDHVMLALSYMWENMAIRNWVQHIMNTIDGMVSPAQFSPVSVNSEQLWGEFQVEFETAFTNTTKLQDAEAALEHIHIQQGETTDQYIAHFEDLMDKAGWLECDHGTINTFRCRLHEPMQKAIFMKDLIPTMFTTWKEATWKEASCYVLMKSMGMFQKWEHKPGFKFSNPKAQQCWGQFTQGNQTSSHKCDPNTIDIDTIHVNQLTMEEKDKCVKEGHCFRCQKQEHWSKECPLKKAANTIAQFAAQTQRAHMHTNEVVDNHNTKADDAKLMTSDATTFSQMDTIHNLWAPKEEEHLELIDELFKDTQDFP